MDPIMGEDSRYLDDFLTPRDKRKIKKARKRVDQQHTNVQELYRHQPKPLKAKTKAQASLINAIYTGDQIVTYGAAGTGKTFIPAYIAAQLMLERKIETIVITRPNIPTGRSIGFFPGTLEEKMAPWITPLTKIFREVMGDQVFEIAMKRGNIEVVPFEVIRGRTFDNSFVILDEAQNTTKDEIKAFLTRMGEYSKVVINGDIEQSDIRGCSGLGYILDIIYNDAALKDKVSVIKFTSDDIVRSGICKDWTKAFERHNNE